MQFKYQLCFKRNTNILLISMRNNMRWFLSNHFFICHFTNFHNIMSSNLWEYIYNLFWVEIGFTHNSNVQCLYELYTVALETESLVKKLVFCEHSTTTKNKSHKKEMILNFTCQWICFHFWAQITFETNVIKCSSVGRIQGSYHHKTLI